MGEGKGSYGDESGWLAVRAERKKRVAWFVVWRIVRICDLVGVVRYKASGECGRTNTCVPIDDIVVFLPDLCVSFASRKPRYFERRLSVS